MDLQGQVAIITGAGQGMGRGIAEKLSQEGAKVVVADKSEKGVLDTVQILESRGGEALAVVADISKNTDIKKMFEQCRQHFASPDIFVANAGLSYRSQLVETTEEEYYLVYDINAKGTFFCLKEAGLQLNDGGRIVVISSSSTRYPNKGMSLYTSTKAAVKIMVEVAAMELGGRGIRVNCVLPGLTETPKVQEDLPLDYKQFVADNTPLKRLGRPDDIAGVVAFLCSEESKWVNGQHIIANGGCNV